MAKLQVMCSPHGDRSGSRRRTAYQAGGREVHHVVDRGAMRSLCGRDASGWLIVECDDIMRLVESAFCCAACRRIASQGTADAIVADVPSLRDRVARRIYDATPGAENDPWDAAIRRRLEFGLEGATSAVTTAYAQADAAIDEMRHASDT